MSEIRSDYGGLLTEQVDEARLAGNLQGLRRRQSEHKVRRARIAASALTAVVCALCSVTYTQISVTDSPAAVQITSRESARCVSEPSEPCNERVIAFSEGSRVARNRDTRLQLVENNGQRVRSVLHQGWARFSVQPGGRRRWLVDLGALQVEVIGTAFTVLRQGTLARVRVHHGRVLVRGAHVPGGSSVLTAGQSFSVGGATARAVLPASAESALPQAVPSLGARAGPQASSRPANVLPLQRQTAPRPRSRTRAQLPSEQAEQALVEADRLRLAGDAAGGHDVLTHALSAEPHGPHAGLVAFTLAQLSLDALDMPERAARELDQALESGSLSRSLREQAMARRVEALGRAGQLDEARRARERYLTEYPGGRWIDVMVRWAPTE